MYFTTKYFLWTIYSVKKSPTKPEYCHSSLLTIRFYKDKKNMLKVDGTVLGLFSIFLASGWLQEGVLFFLTIKQKLCIYEAGLYPLVWLIETMKLIFTKDDFDILLLCLCIYTLCYYFHINTSAILDLCYRDIHYHVTVY